MKRAVKWLAALSSLGAAGVVTVVGLRVTVFALRPNGIMESPAEVSVPETGAELTLEDLRRELDLRDPPLGPRKSIAEENLLFSLTNGGYGGTVVAVDTRSITIEGKAATRSRRPDERAVSKEGTIRLAAVGPLGRGEPAEFGVFDGLHGYRLSDVEVGDRVSGQCFAVSDGRWAAVEVLIRRRPGGRVPPMTGNDFWHQRMNAQQDWEEKLIPAPPGIDPRDNRSPPRRPRPAAPPNSTG